MSDYEERILNDDVHISILVGSDDDNNIELIPSQPSKIPIIVMVMLKIWMIVIFISVLVSNDKISKIITSVIMGILLLVDDGVAIYLYRNRYRLINLVIDESEPISDVDNIDENISGGWL